MSTSMAAQAEDAAPLVLRAPLFESLIDSFADEQRHVVMDLGPARASMIDRLARYRCRLDIVDLPDRLESIQVAEEASVVERLVRRLVPAGNEPVEVIFCWNLLNYLRPELIAGLMEVLAERLAPGGRVHALIEYSATRMPGHPGRMAPAADGGLELEPSDAAPVAAPRYSYTALEKLMPGLKSERAMLLGNGMQEYLFRRPPP